MNETALVSICALLESELSLISLPALLPIFQIMTKPQLTQYSLFTS